MRPETSRPSRSWRLRVAAIAILITAAPAVVASTAQARTECGLVPAVGVAYRVTAAHIEFQATGHFQDANGDYGNGSFTMSDSVTRPQPWNPFTYAVFDGCPGKAPAFWAQLTPRTSSMAVTASWFDSGVEDGNPPANYSCHGAYRPEESINVAWNTLQSNSLGEDSSPHSPRLAVGGYVNPTQIGSCVPDNVEVLTDIVHDAVDATYFTPARLPAETLWHKGRYLTIPVNVSHSGRAHLWGLEDTDPGAVDTISLRWRGSISFERFFTCTPNGCATPTLHPPAADRPQ